MVFHSFLPLVDDISTLSPALLGSLIRVGPIVVPSQFLSTVLQSIVSNPECGSESESESELEGADIYVDVESSSEDVESLRSKVKKLVIPFNMLTSDNVVSSGWNKEDIIVKISQGDLISSLERSKEGSESPYVGLGGVIVTAEKAEEVETGVSADIIKTVRKSLSPPGSVYFSVPNYTPETSSQSSSSSMIIRTSVLSSPETVAKLYVSSLVSDRSDCLIPTIVSTPVTPSSTSSASSSSSSISSPGSTPLGLVYSSKESVIESIVTGRGVYQSRRHGLWRKGETSGATQRVIKISKDCDRDALLFQVEQKKGTGFCHENTKSCFTNLATSTDDELRGIRGLEATLKSRLADAPEGSYTQRLFNDAKLLSQKIAEEADELVDAEEKQHVAFEMADLIYFAMVKCVKSGVSWSDVEASLDAKAEKGKKGIRRQGDAKPKYVERLAEKEAEAEAEKQRVQVPEAEKKPESTQDAPVPKEFPAAKVNPADAPIRMRTSDLSAIISPRERADLLQRPVMDSSAMIERVKPIVTKVREGGDAALKSLTAQFDKAHLESNTLLPPFTNDAVRALPVEVTDAINQAYSNVKAFHAAQAEKEPLVVEPMPGVVCTRFARPIDRVGIYVPGGTAILPSTALMLGVPAQVAGCKTIVLATPPRSDGSISPEVLYVADLTGVNVILKAGGAQAVAAMAYGTEECPKVDKIFGPGNQWVTAAKMFVQNDTQALVGIDMPAGPSEVMVIADYTANPVFVASDLLSQAEHGIDSQVVLVAIDLSAKLLEEIEHEVEKQARALPRVEIIKQAIAKSLIVKVKDLDEAMAFSNDYAPEHLILHLVDSPGTVKMVNNAGSVFVGAFSPER